MDKSALLARGYFPQELPPAFTTTSFAAASVGLPAPRSEWTAAARYNLSRPGNLRRALSIPNPGSQYLVADRVASAWSALEAVYARSELSISKPTSDSDRALRTQVSFGDRADARSKRMYRARFSLVSDVSQFYDSIYTHSVPWALDGKSAEKTRLRTRGQETAACKVDQAIRHGQEGQTKGIPIGPDTSLAIAEAILCDIDNQLASEHPSIIGSSLRFMDDIEVFASSRNEAENVLLTWEALLASYELLINPEKTHIIDGPATIEQRWRTSLSQFVIREDTDGKTARDVREFLGLAFELKRDHPREPIVGYAIRRLRGVSFGSKSWSTFATMLLTACIVEPSSMRYVRDALQRGRKGGHGPDAEKLSSTLSDIVNHHAPLEHGSEVGWALWILGENGGKLDSGGAARAAAMEDNTSLILLRHLVTTGAIDGQPPDLTEFEARASAPEALYARDWLIAYESAAQGWVAPSFDDPFFDAMLDAEVKFFDPTTIAGPSDSVAGPPEPSIGFVTSTDLGSWSDDEDPNSDASEYF